MQNLVNIIMQNIFCFETSNDAVIKVHSNVIQKLTILIFIVFFLS